MILDTSLCFSSFFSSHNRRMIVKTYLLNTIKAWISSVMTLRRILSRFYTASYVLFSVRLCCSCLSFGQFNIKASIQMCDSVGMFCLVCLFCLCCKRAEMPASSHFLHWCWVKSSREKEVIASMSKDVALWYSCRFLLSLEELSWKWCHEN